MSVTAVVLSHQNKDQVVHMLKRLSEQTVKPDEVILSVCCMDVSDLVADVKVVDTHADDFGHGHCDKGLRLSTSDYTFFASADDDYDDTFIEALSAKNADLILGGFRSHLAGDVRISKPCVGEVTRGSFLIKTVTGQRIGYSGRGYSYDGQFILDVVKSGATVENVAEILHYHN